MEQPGLARLSPDNFLFQTPRRIFDVGCIDLWVWHWQISNWDVDGKQNGRAAVEITANSQQSSTSQSPCESPPASSSKSPARLPDTANCKQRAAAPFLDSGEWRVQKRQQPDACARSVADACWRLGVSEKETKKEQLPARVGSRCRTRLGDAARDLLVVWSGSILKCC
jgi:hypothetical protein